MGSILHWAVGRVALIAALAFTGAAGAQSTPAPPAAAGCADCGVVQSVRQLDKRGQPTGVGAVAGGVMGGIVGHQFGSGRGNTAATVAGAGAGAYAGHQVEKYRMKKTYWNVSVKMDNGSIRNYSYNEKPSFREGDRVKTQNDGRRLALVAN